MGKEKNLKLANISFKYCCFKNLCEGGMPMPASKIDIYIYIKEEICKEKKSIFKMLGKNKRLKMIQKSEKSTVTMGNRFILFHGLFSLPSSKLGIFLYVAGANKAKNLKSSFLFFFFLLLLYLQKNPSTFID